MNRLSSPRLRTLLLMFFLSAGLCITLHAGSDYLTFGNASELLPQQKKAKIKKPVSAEKAKKQAEERDKKRKKEGEKYIKENRERSLEIQTPEVRERMKQNVKDANANYKAKKKSNASRTKKAGRRYR